MDRKRMWKEVTAFAWSDCRKLWNHCLSRELEHSCQIGHYYSHSHPFQFVSRNHPVVVGAEKLH